MSTNTKLPEIIIAALLFWYIGLSAHFDIFSSIWSLYDEKRASQLLFIFSILFIIILSRNIRKNIIIILQKTSLFVKASIILLILLGITSSLFAPLSIYAFTESLTFLSLAMISLAVAATTIKTENLIFIFIVLATWLFLFIYEVKFLTSYIAAILIDNHINFQLLFPHFGNVRFFNQFQIWLTPISLAPLLVLKINNKVALILLYLLSGLWITILITSQSRGAQLSFLIAILLTLIIYGKSSLRILKITSVVYGIGLSIYLLLFKLIPNSVYFFSHKTISPANLIQVINSQDSFLVRLELWEKAIICIKGHPILGIGPMHYAYYPGKHAHPHNSLLQIASEFGLPFFLISFSLIILFLYKWVKFSRFNKNSHIDLITNPTARGSNICNNQQVYIVLFISLVSGLIYSTVSGIFVMPMPQTMIAILAGLMIGVRFSQFDLEPITGGFQSISIQIMVGMIAIGLFLSILPHITTRILNPFFATYLPRHTVGPRYWEIGGLLQDPASFTPFYYEHPALNHKQKNS